MVEVVNARDIRNGWGLNGFTYDNNGARAMALANTRWARHDLYWHQDNGQGVQNLQVSMQNIANYFDPNPRFQGIVDDYVDAFYSWSAQMAGLNNALQLKTPNGNKLYACIEGPNEIGGGNGGGSILPDTYPGGIGAGYIAASGQSDAHDQKNRQYLGIWSKYIHDYKAANPTLWQGVELIGGTILEVGNGGSQTGRAPSGLPGDYTGAAWPNGDGVGLVGLVDYGCFHVYPTSDQGEHTPSGPDNNNNPADNIQLNYDNWYHGFADGTSQGGGFNGIGLVVSEVNGNGAWSSDGTGKAWLNAAVLLEHFAMGGHRVLYYQAPEDGRVYGFFSSYPDTLNHNGLMLANMADLFSLKNSYTDPSNLTSGETLFSPPAFVPAFTGPVTVTDNTGNARFWPGGNHIICPKSDGSTMIPVWREPKYDNGNGTNTVDGSNPLPPVCSVTVNFGSPQTYNIWDPTGAGSGGQAGNTRNFAKGPTKVAGPLQGSSATFNLYAAPVFVELISAPITGPPTVPGNFVLGVATSTRAPVSWTASTNQPASYTMEYQQGTSTGAWTTQATIDASNTTYTYYGLLPNIQYYFRMKATNSKGDSPYTGSITTTTKPASATTTPAVVGSNFTSVRADHLASSSITLRLTSAPQAGNAVFVFFNGFAGTGANSNAIVAPAGAEVISKANYDGGSEVTWCWKITSNVTSNSFIFTNFDNTNDAAFKLIEISNAATHDTNHGSVSTATATQITWPLVAPAHSNAIRLTQLSIQFPITSVGTTSSGTTTRIADTSAAFHIGVLLTETPTAPSPASLTISGGTANDTDSYLNVNVYGTSIPNQVTGVTASNTTANATTLAWNSVVDATSYQIDVSTNSGTTWNQLAVLSPVTTTYNVTTLSPKTDYQFRVEASSDAGVGAASTSVPVSTLAQNSLLYIQSAIGVDHAIGQTGTVTATLPNTPALGNMLVFYFTTRNTNSGLTPPSGAQNIVSLTADTNAHCMQMMWTQTVSSAVKTFTYTGYIDGACLCVAEVQGVTSVDTPHHSGSIAYTDNASVTLPITAPSGTPALGIYGVNMANGPDSWGTMPSGVALLQAGLGNVGSSVFEYRQAAFFKVDSTVATGTKVIPFSLGAGVIQESNPEYAALNLLGTVQVIQPGPATLTFGTATTTTQPLTINPATGTVTDYKVSYSANANMNGATVIDVPTGLSLTVTGLDAGVTYYYTVQAFNGTAGGPISAIVHNATATGSNSQYIRIGGKIFVLDGKNAKY